MKPHSSDISLVLGTCDAYSDLWNPFFFQLLKHWPDFNMPVYVASETSDYSYPGIVTVAARQGGKRDKRWSKRLIETLNDVSSEFVLFMLDDFWLNAPADPRKIERVTDIMRSDPKIGFVCLLHEPKPFLCPEEQRKKECEYPELKRCMSNDLFRISAQAGIWRKDYLKKILRKNETPWDFENMGNFRSYFYLERIYNVKESILFYPRGGIIWNRRVFKDYISMYPENRWLPEIVEKRGIVRGVEEFTERRTRFTYLKERAIAIFLKHFSRMPWTL